MTSASFDPNQSKIGRGQIWDSAAQGYSVWWPHIEKAAQSLSNRLVELAEIGPGQRILDIATGIGEPALTAARIVGTTGHILAIDISTEMIAIAKQRAASNGLQTLSNIGKPMQKSWCYQIYLLMLHYVVGG
jgi:ubiquinone/menaquinone biosynthesis C-methylase UbiE